jgi:putative transposase
MARSEVKPQTNSLRDSLHRWTNFGGRSPEVKRLRQLEQENTRLKKLLAERDLEVEVMKEIAAKKW